MSLFGNGTAQMGWNTFIGVAEEITYGTVVTATAFVEFTSESFKRVTEEKILPSLNSTRDFMRRLQGNIVADGSLEMDLNLAENGQMYILKQAMGGTVTSTTVGAGCVRHTFALGDMENNKGSSSAANVKGLTIQVQKGNTTTSIFQMSGCRVNSLALKSEAGGELMLSSEIIAKNGAYATTTLTPIYSNVNPLNFANVTILTGATTTSMSTTTIQNFELTINNNLVTDTKARELGSRTLSICPPTQREIRLKMSMRYETNTAFNYMDSGTSFVAYINIDSGVTAGAAAGNTTYSMQIKLPKLYVNGAVQTIGDKGVITYEIDCPALIGTTTDSVMSLEVWNGTANY